MLIITTLHKILPTLKEIPVVTDFFAHHFHQLKALMGNKYPRRKKSRQARAGIATEGDEEYRKVSVGLKGQEDIGPTSQSSKSFYVFYVVSK